MTRWIVDRLGPDVPVHFTSFHPDWKLLDRPPTPSATLMRARDIALANGIRYAYTGNVRDVVGQSTRCHNCGVLLIERDWYQLGQWGLDERGRCSACGERCAGVFDGAPGCWGARRLPIRVRG
jgi:pyruvate formate lyase activating enzyme